MVLVHRLFLKSHTLSVLSSATLTTILPDGWNITCRTQLSCPICGGDDYLSFYTSVMLGRIICHFILGFMSKLRKGRIICHFILDFMSNLRKGRIVCLSGMIGLNQKDAIIVTHILNFS